MANVIYVYRNNVESTKGLVKVGMTSLTGRSKKAVKESAMKRIESDHTTNGASYELLDCFISKFDDKEFHRILSLRGCAKTTNGKAREWFDCSSDVVRKVEAYLNADENEKVACGVDIEMALKAHRESNVKEEAIQQVLFKDHAYDVAGANAVAKKRHKENQIAKSNAASKNIAKALGIDDPTIGQGSYDEYYTMVKTIKDEIMNHAEYRMAFFNATVVCPCDDTDSAFYRFFRMYFKELNLKKVICTSFCESPKALTDRKTGLRISAEAPKAKKLIMTLDKNGNVHTSTAYLKGNGDCFGQEVIEIMKEADIVCTNPPFGGGDNKLINLCISLKKKFLIIGCSNSGAKGTMINSFDKDWRYGYANKNSFYFRTTDLVILRKTGENKQNQLKMMDDIVAIDDSDNPVWKESLCVKILCSWYTNIRNGYDNLDFVKSLMKNKYAEKIKNYPTIENVENAIAVLGDNCRGNVNEIPCDYDGLMLVPQTFIENNFDSRYFEVVSNGYAPKSIVKGARKETLDKYFEQSKCRVSENTTLAVYTNKNGIVKVAGANFGVYVKWKVKEREALKKELGL